MITDEDVIKYFYSTGKLIKLTTCKLKNMPDEIKEYLNNRFTDSDSFIETIYRIKNKIFEKPKCIICGKPITFGKYNTKFNSF